MSPKKAIVIILILAVIIAIIFTVFYFFNKQEPTQKIQEQITPPPPAQESQADTQRKDLEQLRNKYKVDNNSDAQLKKQHKALEELAESTNN